MYQVIKMYGDFEPWWFLEGWQDDIVASQTFERYQDAVGFYQKERARLIQTLSQREERSEEMAAFWDPEDQRWCEECDAYLQQYHSLLILNQAQKWEQLAVSDYPRPIHCRFQRREKN